MFMGLRASDCPTKTSMTLRHFPLPACRPGVLNVLAEVRKDFAGIDAARSGHAGYVLHLVLDIRRHMLLL